MLRLAAAVAKIAMRMSAASRSNSQVGNPVLDAGAARRDPAGAGMIVEGDVVRSGPGWYDMTVRVAGMGDIACVALMSTGHTLLGVSESKLPVEGSRVLLWLSRPGDRYGKILGVIPNHSMTARVDKGKTTPPNGFGTLFELEANATAASEAAYAQPLRDKLFLAKINGGAGRPLDMFPGNYGLLNEQGVGMAITGLASTLKASSKAQVRVSAIDDQVRIMSGYFQHFDALGGMQSFNDGGHNSEERHVTPYQCERSGFNEIGTPAFEQGEKKTLNAKSLNTSVKCVKPQTVPRRRLHQFLGFFGDLINIFVGKPDPTLNPETLPDKNLDQGLAQVHIDASGYAIVRSAKGILLQRWDRIPIPKRVKQPWDPKGDKVEDTQGKLPPKKPFLWDKTKPYSRSLQWRDGLAWLMRNAYWHLHNQCQSTDHKDFYLPEEKDMKTPDQEYDTPGNGTEEYAKYDLRQSGIGLEDDGSVIIRDAWGSEIVMRGGNIIISCAGQLEQRPGKSSVTLAGHDVIVKARQSVDISATEQDVRIKSEGNMHIVSEGANGKGGVLIQSLSKNKPSESGWDGTKGEDVESRGVVISAPDSTVLMTAPDVHVAADDAIRMETLKSESGRIEIGSATIHANADSEILLTANKTSGLSLVNGSAILGADSVIVAGDSSAAVFMGTKTMVPLDWYDTGTNPYSMLSPRIEQIAERLQGTDWVYPYKPEVREKIKFTYRTSTQYGTDKPSEIQGAKAFSVFQPFWAVMAKAGSQMVPVSPAKWAERELEQTLPWPGKEARDTAYAKLESEVNVTPATGVAKIRKDLKEEGGNIVDTTFDEYEVIPHN